MITFKRLAIYLFTFLVILLVFVIVMPDFWKKWDYSVYKSVSVDEKNAAEKLSKKIAVINIEKPDLNSNSASLEEFRKRIISFLNTVGNQENLTNEKPDAILLDISFSKDTTLLSELKTALEKLKEKKIKVYAVYSLKFYDEEIPIYELNDEQQAAILYDSVLTGGRLHAGFELVDGTISYPSDIFLQSAFSETEKIKIESIVKRVALDDGQSNFPQEFKQSFSPLGPIEAIREQTHEFETSAEENNFGTFDPPIDINEKFVLVGDLSNDYESDMSTPRTYFLAWALNEKIIPEKILKQPIVNLGIIIGQTLFFGLFNVFVFALLFKYVKRFQTKPNLIAILSFAITLSFFLLYGFLMLNVDKVIPVGLTLLSIVLATILCWRFAYKFLVTGVADGGQKYDVFISYSHGNSDWVKKNIIEPLNEFRKPNGDKLSIFFDEKSIGIGEPFTAKYMWGIVDSKVFIPIMSEEYYNKNHCKNEMDLAYKRSVEKLIDIMPVVFTFQCVPPIYTHIKFFDINEVPDYMAKIKEELSKVKVE